MQLSADEFRVLFQAVDRRNDRRMRQARVGGEQLDRAKVALIEALGDGASGQGALGVQSTATRVTVGSESFTRPVRTESSSADPTGL